MHVTTQSGTTAGSVVAVLAVLTESGTPLGRRAAVTADLTMPDGTARSLVLGETEPGVFRATHPLPQLGHYPLRVKAEGRTFAGAAFTREELRSAATWTQPPGRPADPPIDGARCCELLLRLLEEGGTARLGGARDQPGRGSRLPQAVLQTAQALGRWGAG